MFTKPPKAAPRKKGEDKEKLAETFLQQRGLTLVTRNFLCKVGEIDLIMRDGNVCVFVEVRYRSNSAFGSPSETVNYTKQKKIVRTAQLYLQQNATYNELPCRFDVVAISGKDNHIEWIADAFYA